MLDDYQKNGRFWYFDKLKEYFNEGHLHLIIAVLCHYEFNFNYRQPACQNNGNYPIGHFFLESLPKIVEAFEIVIPHSSTANQHNFENMFAWLMAAQFWISEVVAPLLEMLKEDLTLSKVGATSQNIKQHIDHLQLEIEQCHDPLEKENLTREQASLQTQADELDASIFNAVATYMKDIRLFIKRWVPLYFPGLTPWCNLDCSTTLNNSLSLLRYTVSFSENTREDSMRQATDMTKPAPIGTEEYLTLSRDFRNNGSNWSPEQMWHYFKWEYLHGLIVGITGVDISCDYDHINDLSVRLIDLLKILNNFGIKLPLPDQEIKDCSLYSEWLAPWFNAAQTWISDIIVPLLMTIMTYEPLVRAGAHYQKNKHRIFNLNIQLKSRCSHENETYKSQLRSEIQGLSDQNKQLYAYISAVIEIHFNRIIAFIQENIQHKYPHIVKSNIHYFTPTCVANTFKLPLIVQQLPPIEVCERVYRHTTMKDANRSGRFDCGYAALSIGLMFHAQQELSQSNQQQPVFNKIATLFSDKPRMTLAKIILELSFNFTSDYFALNRGNASEFINEFRRRLQKNAIQIVILKIKEELNKETTDWNDPILLDIITCFMRYYNNSPLKDIWNAYICYDKSIRDSIISAVTHIKQIEKISHKKLIYRHFEMGKSYPQLNSTGLSLFISNLLMSLKADTNQAVDHHSIQGIIDKYFNDNSFHELQRAFFYYYDGGKDEEGVLYLKQFNPTVLKSIKTIAEKLKEYPEKRYIKRTAPQYFLTEEGLQILRGHLLKDPRFSVAEREKLRNLSANQAKETAGTGFFTTLFSKASVALSPPPNEVEMPVITAQTPLIPKSSSQTKTRTVSLANQSYGACHPAEEPTTDFKNTVEQFSSDELLFDYYGSHNEIITLAKQLFNVQVMFHDDSAPGHPTLIRDELPMIHIYNTAILAEPCKQILIDPFPKCRTFIHPKILNFSTVMTSADLSSKEVSTIFKPFTPVKISFLRDRLFPETDKYTLLAMAICRFCENPQTSIEKILNYIKDNIPQESEGIPPKDFMSRVDYVFYRYHGKSFAEFKAMPLVDARRENIEEHGIIHPVSLASKTMAEKEEKVSPLSPPTHR